MLHIITKEYSICIKTKIEATTEKLKDLKFLKLWWYN